MRELNKRKFSIYFLSNVEWEEKATPQDEPTQTLKLKSKKCLFTATCQDEF